MSRPRTFILLGFLLSLLASVVRADEAPRLLATADGEGALAPCADCPLGLGGMAKRATLIERERGKGGPVLLVDAGNSLFGPESMASKGRIVARLFGKLGYDAVNVSWRDFRMGREATLAALAEAPFAVLSANLTDAETGELLFAPSVLVNAGDRRVLVIGGTRVPVERDSLPHLARQLEGVGFRPTADAVRNALAAAPDHDDALLLYYGDVVSLRQELGEILPQFAAVVVGGAHPDDLPPGSDRKLLAVRPKGRSIARLSLGAPESEPAELRVESTLPEDAGVAAIVVEALTPALTEPPALPDDRRGDIPESLRRSIGSIAIRGEGENRGFGLIVHGVEIAYNFAGLQPGRGRRTFLVDVSVENRLAPDLLIEESFPETMQVMEVRRQFFLLLNQDTIVPLMPDAWEKPGHLPAGFRLPPGEAADGLLAFAVPTEGVRSLELRFYPDGFDPIVVPLKDGERQAAAPAVAGPYANGEIEVAVTGFERREEFLGQKPGDGRVFAVVDLRGRSLLEMQAPALALRADGRPGEKAPAGQVFEWKKGHQLINLVTEGMWGYPAHKFSSAGEVPMFLPDVTAGFTLVFEVPAEDEAFRLDCHFPRMKLSTESAFRDPSPIILPLAGEEREVGRIALAALDDSPLRVGVLDLQWVDEFASRNSGDKYVFAVFTVAFRNEGEEGGLLDPAERFGLSWADRNPASVVSTTNYGPRPGGGLAYLPPRQIRAFQLVFRVPKEETSVELDYTGVSTAVRLPFDRAAPKEPAVSLATPEESEPPSPGVSPRVSEPREPKGLAGFGIDGADVNRAIDRGREFLWKYLNEEHLSRAHYDFGDVRSHILAALALIHSDAVARTPGFDAELRKLLARAPLRSTYEMGLFLMAVRSYGDPEFYPRAVEVAQTLLDQQGPKGSWTYGRGVPAVKPEPEEAAAAKGAAGPVRRDGPFKVTGGEPPPEPEKPAEEEKATFEPVELKRSVPWEEGRDGDNSCTQFALLGLRSAESIGIKVPPETWRRALSCFRQRQGRGGGWGYGQGGGYGSMTCAGTCSVALSRHALGEEPFDRDPDIDEGVNWLAERFRVNRNPKRSDWAYYYIYSVERVGRLLGTEFIGPWEWYPLGVKSLLGRQGADGSWVGSGKEKEPEIATSFALLFLTRATEGLKPEAEKPPAVAERPEEEPGPGRLVTKAVKPPASRFYFVLDCSGSMRADMGGRSRFEIARDALRDLVNGLPDNAEVGLRVYGHRYFAIKAEANRDTELVLPLGRLDRERFGRLLAALKPKGKTPLAFSVAEATKDLRGGPVTVVLLTDGGEDTIPRGDPVAEARRLGGRGDVELKVVGFAIGRPDWRKQLENMAAAAGGQYLAADDAAALAAGLRATAGVVPEAFAVLDAAGTVVAKGKFGDELELPPGTYRFRAKVGTESMDTAFYVASGATVRITYDPAGGK